MNYLRDNRYSYIGNKHRRLSPAAKIAGAAALALLIYLWGGWLLYPIGRVLDFVWYPLIRASSQAVADRPTADLNVSSKEFLIQEVVRLRSEVDKLKLETAAVNDIKRENDELRLRQEEREAPVRLTARVLARPPQILFDVLLVDAGKKENPSLRKGQLVFLDAGDVAIGQVSEILDYHSKVSLFSSPGQKIPVLVGEKGVQGIATGRSSGNFSVQLARGEEIKIGDPVYTSLLGRHLMGTVGRIVKDPNNPFQEIYVKSPFSFFYINWVEISYD